jgi:tRNA-Thr(GGU) m(6)t(6)A37 methyltransferase TsaA
MIEFKAIGIIHTPFVTPEGTPIQPVYATDACGTVEVFNEYEAGLKDLDGFSHIFLLYHFHRSQGFSLQLVPFMDTQSRGVFATRAPKRPNPIGLSLVALQSIEGRVLRVQNVDILDGTPLLDIKPYVPEFDSYTDVRAGWLEKVRKTVMTRRSDDRFK